ncbi:MAG: sigma-70 family RNA polymerase sigma factor [Planctomycetota bacterium]|jgi:RNA polymerase sigma-70 factor (ECF subfamily)
MSTRPAAPAAPTADSTELDAAGWLDRHGDALYAFAVLHLGDRDAAEDRVQETLLAALEARTSFRGASSVRTWLIGILKNKIRDHLRRGRRTAAALPTGDAGGPPDSWFTEQGKWKVGPAPWRTDPEDPVTRAEFWETFRGCLAGLPPPMRDAFCLRELHRLSTGEIREVLGISDTNLWTLLHRGRARLQECLGRRWFGRGERGSVE